MLLSGFCFVFNFYFLFYRRWDVWARKAKKISAFQLIFELYSSKCYDNVTNISSINLSSIYIFNWFLFCFSLFRRWYFEYVGCCCILTRWTIGVAGYVCLVFKLWPLSFFILTFCGFLSVPRTYVVFRPKKNINQKFHFHKYKWKKKEIFKRSGNNKFLNEISVFIYQTLL